MNNNLFNKVILLTAVIAYTVTAINSKGYYHGDEHYQIIEFSGIKSGTHTANELAWEYNANIRSALMPSVCYGLFSMLNFISITDPYTQTAILRILTGLLCIFVIQLFIKSNDSIVNKNNKTAFLILSFFLWFLPVLNVRFSSETLSGITFLFAVSILQLEKFNSKRFSYFVIGAILGISFLCRFQSVILSIGLIGWLVFINKTALNKLIQLLFGVTVIIVLGVLIDCWFYQKFVISFYNYFHVFSTTDDLSSSFGTLPWYYYILYLIKFPFFPIGILILLSFIILIIKSPKSIIVWTVIPFIIIHSLIHHKEERFLFPIVNFLPVILILAYQQIESIFLNRKFYYLKLVILIPLVLLNIVGLFAMSTKSAGVGRMDITSYIHNQYKADQVNLISCQWSSPYNPWQSLPTKYYQEKNVKEVQIKSLCTLSDTLIDNTRINLLVLRKAELNNPECVEILAKMHCLKLRQSIPEWMELANNYYSGIDKDDILVLYLIKGGESFIINQL